MFGICAAVAVAGGLVRALPAAVENRATTVPPSDNQRVAPAPESPAEPCYHDFDGDGFGAGAPVPTRGACQHGDVTNNSDCYDGNANARPGQTACFDHHRGDFSFDYDCSDSSTICAGPSFYITSCGGGGCMSGCSQSTAPAHIGQCGQQVPVGCGPAGGCANGCQVVSHAVVSCN